MALAVPQKPHKTWGFSPWGTLCADRAAFMQPVLELFRQCGRAQCLQQLLQQLFEQLSCLRIDRPEFDAQALPWADIHDTRSRAKVMIVYPEEHFHVGQTFQFQPGPRLYIASSPAYIQNLSPEQGSFMRGHNLGEHIADESTAAPAIPSSSRFSVFDFLGLLSGHNRNLSPAQT
jgi:hypothetical protein